MFKKTEKLFKNINWDFIDARKIDKNKQESCQKHNKIE